MTLRFRLFIWVGILFILAFTISFFVEEHVTRTNLLKTRENLLQELYKVNEQKRKSIESYIADILWKLQARIDSVLQGVANYKVVQKGFAPTEENLTDGTWLDAASLMITNQWLGFVQNTSDDTTMSDIVVHSDELTDTFHFPLQDNIHLVAMEETRGPKNWSGPYIGIKFNLNTVQQQEDTFHAKEADENYYVYFKPEALLRIDVTGKTFPNIGLSVNLLEPFLKWIEIPYRSFYLESFISSVKEAQTLLKSRPDMIPAEEKWAEMIQKKIAMHPNRDGADFKCFDYVHERTDVQLTPAEFQSKTEILKYVKNYIEHYNKVGLIWGVSALTDTKLFGHSPLSPDAPLGMGMLDTESFCGKGLRSDQVFRSKIQYDVQKATEKLKMPVDFILPHLDVITPSDFHHVFFGNTLKLQDPKTGKTSFLTLAAHEGPVLSALARATHQTLMFVSNGKIIAVSNPRGEEVAQNSPWFQAPVEKLMGQTSGVVTFGGKEYFFLHISPYHEADLHFFVFNLKSKEFQFIDSINEGTEDLIEKLSMQMRAAAVIALVIVLFLLNNIAKRVTKPIAHLAEVTQTVAEGKLHEIEIPKETDKKRTDEVYALYHAFFEMVKGLREKEKVRGVLNKVVSKEIAEETLKGNVQLGGEEKRVTVFFADIRNFTALTERMDPKDVIHLINSCMTRISEKIDQYGGVIDKYVGDEVMALFGAPIEKKDSALNAIKCAVDVIASFSAWNQTSPVPIELGIGIHTRTVVAGNMGAENRLNYTVLGANVNLAARLCDRAAPRQILISSATLDEEDVKVNIDCEPLDPIELKGFTEPVPVFSVTNYKR
ncbi:adenylate/guanylate cyclase domain-containing protein [Simkania sp.]|uniref:adenylate/guanylate cyclase domain-containing protein n=1 Tax=Simkania sp. TaxID=34094 RepID=UPI003B520F1D